jgi:simple sugar transport system substrate-binding protein
VRRLACRSRRHRRRPNPGLSFAQDQKKMVTVVKISGIPWFNALENGVKKADTDFGIDGSVVGPANLDPTQQVKLLEDLIARKVDVIGLVPIDVKVAEPVLKRAQEAGIPVITHEGPEQKGRTWNVELIDSVVFGEVQCRSSSPTVSPAPTKSGDADIPVQFDELQT